MGLVHTVVDDGEQVAACFDARDDFSLAGCRE